MKNILNILKENSKPLGKNLVKGTFGLIGLGYIASSGYFSYKTNREQYGAGGAFLMGSGRALAETALTAAFPVLGATAVVSMEAGEAAVKFGRSQYTKNRKANFGRPQYDPFGFGATMRQRSKYSLDRGRANLGNEGRMMHY